MMFKDLVKDKDARAISDVLGVEGDYLDNLYENTADWIISVIEEKTANTPGQITALFLETYRPKDTLEMFCMTFVFTMALQEITNKVRVSSTIFDALNEARLENFIKNRKKQTIN